MEQHLYMYPNFIDQNLPNFAGCSIDRNIGADLPFRRFLPKLFEIQSVNLHKVNDKPSCIWKVEYYFTGLSKLPTGAGLDTLISLLIKFVPLDTIVIGKSVDHPKIITIWYAVMCACDNELTTQLQQLTI